jgi:cytochrome P450
MLRDPAAAMERMAQQYGPVCAMGAGAYRYVYLFGPDAHRELFTDAERFTWREVTKSLIPVDGETAVVVSDGDDHERRRRIVQPAFNIRRIDSMVPLMTGEAERTTAAWRAGDEFDAYWVLRACIRRIVMRALFGERLSGQADDLGDRLQPALDFVSRPLPLQVKVALPGTGWLAARRARRAVDDLVFAEIAYRRAHAVESEDVLTWLLAMGDELSDVEVRDQVISLIAAGYETTSAAVGWTIYAALVHTGVWTRLRDEVAAHVGDGPLTGEAVRAMTFLDGVVNESLRLWPPGVAAGRKTSVELDIDGHRVPAGSLVLYSPYVTQRMAGIWRDPDSFRPERWDPASPAYEETPPLAFVPFGAGPRRCLGFAFALMEIKVIVAHLARSFDLDYLGGDPGRGGGIASMRPRAGVPVRLLARL